MYSFLPEDFLCFCGVLDAIFSFEPIGVSIIGSHGDKHKTTNESSDFDIVFVFDTENIYELNTKIRIEFANIPNLKTVELGVHYQFGFVYSIYFRENPMRWMDVGIMDLNFATNYLVDFPKIDVRGNIKPCKNKEVPDSHLNNLSRKIVRHLNKGQILQATIAAYRYLNWLNVENKVNKIRGLKMDDEFEDIYSNSRELNNRDVLDYVLVKIKNREPQIWAEIKGLLVGNECQRTSG